MVAASVQGFADRIDLTDDGSVIVIDYKTGSARNFGGLDEDPVARGKLLQLPSTALRHAVTSDRGRCARPTGS